MELVQGLVKLLGVYSDDKLTGLKKSGHHMTIASKKK
jgi:hypothetical protein